MGDITFDVALFFDGNIHTHTHTHTHTCLIIKEANKVPTLHDAILQDGCRPN